MSGADGGLGGTRGGPGGAGSAGSRLTSRINYTAQLFHRIYLPLLPKSAAAPAC
jgi:hypothetical protein